MRLVLCRLPTRISSNVEDRREKDAWLEDLEDRKKREVGVGDQRYMVGVGETSG